MYRNNIVENVSILFNSYIHNIALINIEQVNSEYAK